METTWVGVYSWAHTSLWHIARFDDPEATLCGIKVEEDDEIREGEPGEINTCQSCCRLAVKRTHKQEE